METLDTGHGYLVQRAMAPPLTFRIIREADGVQVTLTGDTAIQFQQLFDELNEHWTTWAGTWRQQLKEFCEQYMDEPNA